MKRLICLLLVLVSLPLLAEDGLVWHDPLSENGVIQNGISDDLTAYRRLPDSLQSAVRPPVWSLSTNSAGLAVHFFTNAGSIRVKYKVSGGLGFDHMQPTGVSGIDLYVIDNEGNHHRCCSAVSVKASSDLTFWGVNSGAAHGKGAEFRLYLPLYNTLESLEIGTPEGAEFRFIEKRKERPIIIYGTSITQGACASRAGMAWTTILGRNLDWPVVNLGFSGNGLLEEPLLELMAQTESSLYVLDCLANLCNGKYSQEDVADRIKNAVRILRKSGDTPILLLPHPGSGYQNSLIID